MIYQISQPLNAIPSSPLASSSHSLNALNRDFDFDFTRKACEILKKHVVTQMARNQP
jgi:hypothetical protein